MSETDDDQKTEEPSQKRLDEAREEGRLPISRELATWWLFIAAWISLAWLIPDMGQKLAGSLRPFLESPHEISLDGNGLQRALANVLAQIGVASLMLFGLLAAAAIIGTMLQTGFYFSVASLRFYPERLNPMENFGRMFSVTALVELFKSFVKLVIVGFVVYYSMRPLIDQLPMFVGAEFTQSLVFLRGQAMHLIMMILLVFTVLAVGDFLYQRFQYYKGLRMTKQEVKDEYKQMEGDPFIKSRLRTIRLQRARKRMMAQVPKADVVVTNPTHYAIALQYDNKTMPAPKVIAKGVNRVAERIREVAEQNEVPLVSNPPLARALYETVDIDETITPEHYRAVAEVISYVFKLRKKKMN